MYLRGESIKLSGILASLSSSLHWHKSRISRLGHGLISGIDPKHHNELAPKLTRVDFTIIEYEAIDL